jgi:hypothetical protein
MATPPKPKDNTPNVNDQWVRFTDSGGSGWKRVGPGGQTTYEKRYDSTGSNEPPARNDPTKNVYNGHPSAADGGKYRVISNNDGLVTLYDENNHNTFTTTNPEKYGISSSSKTGATTGSAASSTSTPSATPPKPMKDADGRPSAADGGKYKLVSTPVGSGGWTLEDSNGNKFTTRDPEFYGIRESAQPGAQSSASVRSDWDHRTTTAAAGNDAPVKPANTSTSGSGKAGSGKDAFTYKYTYDPRTKMYTVTYGDGTHQSMDKAAFDQWAKGQGIDTSGTPSPASGGSPGSATAIGHGTQADPSRILRREEVTLNGIKLIKVTHANGVIVYVKPNGEVYAIDNPATGGWTPPASTGPGSSPSSPANNNSPSRPGHSTNDVFKIDSQPVVIDGKKTTKYIFTDGSATYVDEDGNVVKRDPKGQYKFAMGATGGTGGSGGTGGTGGTGGAGGAHGTATKPLTAAEKASQDFANQRRAAFSEVNGIDEIAKGAGLVPSNVVSVANGAKGRLLLTMANGNIVSVDPDKPSDHFLAGKTAPTPLANLGGSGPAQGATSGAVAQPKTWISASADGWTSDQNNDVQDATKAGLDTSRVAAYSKNGDNITYLMDNGEMVSLNTKTGEHHGAGKNEALAREKDPEGAAMVGNTVGSGGAQGATAGSTPQKLSAKPMIENAADKLKEMGVDLSDYGDVVVMVEGNNNNYIVQMSNGTYQSVDKDTGKVNPNGAGNWGDTKGGGYSPITHLNSKGERDPAFPLTPTGGDGGDGGDGSEKPPAIPTGADSGDEGNNHVKGGTTPGIGDSGKKKKIDDGPGHGAFFTDPTMPGAPKDNPYTEPLDAIIAPAPTGGGSCFPAGSLVTVPGGHKPIEDVELGDMVMTWNFSSKSIEPTQVTDTLAHAGKETIIIKSGHSKIITTPEHPFWDGKRWAAASKLKAGSKIMDQGGRLHEVESIHKGPKTDVYNFHVTSPAHNYFVDGFLVHNMKMGF